MQLEIDIKKLMTDLTGYEFEERPSFGCDLELRSIPKKNTKQIHPPFHMIEIINRDEYSRCLIRYTFEHMKNGKYGYMNTYKFFEQFKLNERNKIITTITRWVSLTKH